MLLLHGSRARHEAHAYSDWDFAYDGAPDLVAAFGRGRGLGSSYSPDVTSSVRPCSR